jgi:hypothetical protein
LRVRKDSNSEVVPNVGHENGEKLCTVKQVTSVVTREGTAKLSWSKVNQHESNPTTCVQQGCSKTAAGGENRKTPRGKTSGLRIKEVPASTQHRNITKYTSSSQASGKGDRARPTGTIHLTSVGVKSQNRQRRKGKKLNRRMVGGSADFT